MRLASFAARMAASPSRSSSRTSIVTRSPSAVVIRPDRRSRKTSSSRACNMFTRGSRSADPRSQGAVRMFGAGPGKADTARPYAQRSVGTGRCRSLHIPEPAFLRATTAWHTALPRFYAQSPKCTGRCRNLSPPTRNGPENTGDRRKAPAAPAGPLQAVMATCPRRCQAPRHVRLQGVRLDAFPPCRPPDAARAVRRVARRSAEPHHPLRGM